MKDIQGLEGLYAVTEDGRVWSYPKQWKNNRGAVNGHSGKFLKHGLGGRGYSHVSLKINGKFITKKVHRLVALTFLPNPDNLPEVNHIDNNPLNNSVANLEWCTGAYNLSLRNKTAEYRKDPQTRLNEMLEAGILIEVALYSLS